jgi:hypothetical protein
MFALDRNPRRRRAMKRILVALAALAVGFAGVTWWALESSGVARVSTTAPDGGERVTHVWFVEDAGTLWLEAGAPENPWYRDVRERPELTFAADDRPAARYRAREVPGAAARVRALLRARYGWRDRWVGLWVDASRSTAVRLDPIGEGPAR